ncbi:recombinase family protein [Mesorhizobium sp. XAP10]|uniref:recombinase family protein n=1 Tax=unclassified Mesorhizobium TaxID=325217 RepID=UPI0023E01BAA|nr:MULTISPECIES: recombinase family protein [unclassified Mesorhizobium]MDF3152056.1 recombinase family protein [Mesorhizobium sp. XAP10]MDF3244942.1 recombinase family protein [Mesorhizobium sp. XAP4]
MKTNDKSIVTADQNFESIVAKSLNFDSTKAGGESLEKALTTETAPVPYIGPVAYSYIRWSTAIQGQGDSYRRQYSLAEKWSIENAIPLADDRVMTDAGVSAFKGKNVESGALGAFLKAAEAGKINRGSYLLVESIDRLSRQGMFATAAIVQELWKAGIVIVTLSDGKTYHPDCNDMDALTIVLVAMRAKEESATKGKRVKDSYVKRNARAQKTGEVVSGNLPGWLYKDPETGKAKLNEDKAEIVRRIFDMCLNGCGLPMIAKTLNANGIRPFAIDKRRKGRAEYWTIANVHYILKSKATYGLYHPPKSDPCMIFPPAITIEEYNRAQAGMAQRQRTGKGRKGKTYSNLFGGIAKCAFCKEPMTIRNPKPGRAIQFYCKGSLTGKCHEAAPWNYERFEGSFLSFAAELDLQEIIHGGTASSRQETITEKIQQLEGERLGLFKSQQGHLKMIEADEILRDSLREAMVKNATRIKAINEQIGALEIERNKVQLEREAAIDGNRIRFPKVGTGKGQVNIEELYQLRAKAADHIRTIVESIELNRKHWGKVYRKAAMEADNELARQTWLDAARRCAPKKEAFDSRYIIKFKGGATRTIYPDNRDKEGKEAFLVLNLGFEGADPSKLPKATRTAEEFAKARAER